MKIGITGHQNIPPEAISDITDALRARLQKLEEITGVSSLAAGADQLFASLVIDLGGALEVIIPAARYESTLFGPDLDSYRELLSRAQTIHRLSFSEPDEEAFYAAGKEVVKLSDQLFAVWDGKPAQGLGGTADIVSFAERCGIPVNVIWPKNVERSS
jgi:hypothetical protein